MCPRRGRSGLPDLGRFLALDDFEPAARRHLPRSLFGYVEGATETNAARDGNRAAFALLSFLPRQLVGVADRRTDVELFGRRYAAPFGIAPMGISALTAYRGDLIQARAAAAAGIPAIQSSSSLIAVEEVQQAAPGTWFQVYLPRTADEIDTVLNRVERAGVEVLVVTVDSAVIPNRENNVRNHFRTPLRPSVRLVIEGLTHPRWTIATLLRTTWRHGLPHFENVGAGRGAPILARHVERDFAGREHLSWDTIRAIRRRWRGPLVLKGILHPDDARLAQQAGVDGLIVSNHGGRQLDYAVAPIRMLPRVAEEAGAMCVMVDSGFRRGTDVLKAVALGARCAFVGRPFNYAGAVAGMPGVAHAIELLKREIRASLGLLGVNAVAQVTRDLLLEEVDFNGRCRHDHVAAS